MKISELFESYNEKYRYRYNLIAYRTLSNICDVVHSSSGVDIEEDDGDVIEEILGEFYKNMSEEVQRMEKEK